MNDECMRGHKIYPPDNPHECALCKALREIIDTYKNNSVQHTTLTPLLNVSDFALSRAGTDRVVSYPIVARREAALLDEIARLREFVDQILNLYTCVNVHNSSSTNGGDHHNHDLER